MSEDNVVQLFDALAKPLAEEMSDLEAQYAAARRLAIQMHLDDPVTKERVATAVQGALQAITDQNNKGKTVRVGQAAEVITAVVLDALQPVTHEPPPGERILRA